MLLFIDTETYSPISLTTAGSARYSTQVEVMVVTWSVDGGKPRCWDCTTRPKPPEDLLWAVEECEEIWAHKADFDRRVLETCPWWPIQYAPLSKWRCSMAMALAHGLPGGLDKLCRIFKVDASEAKLDGKELINLFCKPTSKGKRNTRLTHPEKWREFLKYATQDIPAMVAIYRKCPKWNLSATELDLWRLDQTINNRGFAVDIEMAEAAVRATTAEKKRLADRTQELTDYDESNPDTIGVRATTQRDKLLTYLLLEYGVSLPDLKADTIERRLEDPELPEFVKELLRIRLQASKASTSKYKRILQMEVGGRLYGTLQYCAANRTGRWGGRGFQPQNLQRPTHKFPEIEAGIAAMKGGYEDLITDNIMALASSCMRSVIVAAPGKKLVVSDLSNIEGRVLAWLAGEEWKLDAFRAFDRKEGPDLYKVAYGRSFGVDPNDVEDDSDERQIGKVQELALGYQGGVGAFVTMAATYGVDLDLMAQKSAPVIPRDIFRDAQAVYAWALRNRRTLGLPEQVYTVCEALKVLWRNAHPEVETMWASYETAARNAIQNPGVQFPTYKVVFDRQGNWLRIRLPSGRYLCYPSPKVEGNKVSYAGVNVYNKKWHRIYSYGGKFAENIDQATSRDIIADAMPRAEAEDYPIVLTVHDELMAECRDDVAFTDKRLSEILSSNPKWAPGLPLAAKGFTTKRYKKS